MVRKKELVRQLEEARGMNDQLVAERRQYYRALWDAPYAVRSTYGGWDPIRYSGPDDVKDVVKALVAAEDAAKAERDLYRNAYALTQYALGPHVDGAFKELTPDEVRRALKKHTKAGPPRIHYDDSTGLTQVLYPAPPKTPPLEQ